jgi:hypothetical protein
MITGPSCVSSTVACMKESGAGQIPNCAESRIGSECKDKAGGAVHQREVQPMQKSKGKF